MIKAIYLTGVFLRWCLNDIKENFQDIKFRYWMETNKEINNFNEEDKQNDIKQHK